MTTIIDTTTDATTIVHSYEVVNRAGFVNKLAEIVKRFKVDYTLVWGESYVSNIEVFRDEFYDVTFYPVEVSFSFEGFQIEGYKYLGCIKDNDKIGLFTIHGNDFTKDFNISKWIESFKVIPCHACNRKHSRSIGHLFQELATGEVKVFGSGCAKKYFGIDFSRLLNFFTSISAKYSEWNDVSYREVIGGKVFTKRILESIYFVLNRDGYYISKRQSEMERVMSTADMASELSTNTNPLVIQTVKDVVKDVDFSVLWNKSYTKDSNNKTEFEHNIEVIQTKLEIGAATVKDVGFIAFLVWQEFFKIDKTDDKKVFVIPEGVVEGSKIENITVKLVSIHSYTTQWGVSFINIFESDDVRYKCFSSVDYSSRFNIEKDLLIKKATVKSIEDDPKYGKSVIISRPSIKEV